MNLRTKKELAARTFKVGKARVVLVRSRINEIKEAITKQDIKDLKEAGAILIKEVKGRTNSRLKSKPRKRGPGKVKKNVNTRKRDYTIMTRKLRAYVSEAKRKGNISLKEYYDLRKRIRNRDFRSKSHLKEHLTEIKK